MSAARPTDEQILQTITKAFVLLLETKHIFQTTHVPVETLLQQEPPEPSDGEKKGDKYGFAQIVRSSAYGLKCTEIACDNLSVEMALKSRWVFARTDGSASPVVLHRKDGMAPGQVPEKPQIQTSVLKLPKIRIPCGYCDTEKPPHHPLVTGGERDRPFEDFLNKERIVQVFSVQYACQICNAEPIIW